MDVGNLLLKELHHVLSFTYWNTSTAHNMVSCCLGNVFDVDLVVIPGSNGLNISGRFFELC